MEKEKHKNEAKTELNVLDFWHFMRGMAAAIEIAFMISVVIAGLWLLLVLWSSWQIQHFSEVEPPYVQAAIQEQCSISINVADGYFDDSSGYPPPYSYRLDDSNSWLHCYKDGEFWQCDCNEINTP